MNSRCRPNCSTAFVKGGLFLSRADKMVLVTTRCLCRLGFEQTFAELGDEVKNRLSHRAQALQKLQEYLGGIR